MSFEERRGDSITDDGRRRLEQLLKDNKLKQAKLQLTRDLKKYHNIDLPEKDFVDYQRSEEVRRKVYECIKADDIKIVKFPYDQEVLKLKIDFIFDYFIECESTTVLFYPSTFTCGLNLRTGDQLYLNFPLAIAAPLRDCKEVIMKLMSEMHNDLIVVSEELGFGFVLSEDEYSDVTVEYWEDS
ncbi:hypothetical protein [Paenibacillus sp. FSL R7-0179]|uniref:hypothetical protein n=1 Tax=Paenibacillus sp. FSL R7-0179 TaxID=2921672 RepID=UPI0030F956F3